MDKLIDQYKQIIQLWQNKNTLELENMIVANELKPLKLFLLNKEIEGQKLLESFDLQSLEPKKKVFLLEALLYKMPYYPLDEKNIILSREITSIYENAYFGNFTIALENYKNKDYRLTKESYKKMLLIAPNSEKIIVDFLYLCFLTGDRLEIKTWNRVLNSQFIRFFVQIGNIFLSSVFQKLTLFAILTILVLIYPFSLYLISILDIVIIVCLISSIKKNNRLLNFLSIILLRIFLLSTIIGVVAQAL